MLRILGSPLHLHGRCSRRDWLRLSSLSALGTLGVGLNGLCQAKPASSPDKGPSGARLPQFGRARSCILLYLYGAHSQLETFDPKPDAPVEVRGELNSIPSSLTGVRVGELLPASARVMDRVTIVRSVTHPYAIHGVAYATTGIPTIDVGLELSPRDGRHWPFLGSVVDYVDRQRGVRRSVPGNIALPFPFSSQRSGEVHRAGPYAAFLGGTYNPIWAQFQGQATVRTVKTLAEQQLEVAEPYMGINPEGRFDLAGGGDTQAQLTLDRLHTRHSLLEQLDQARRGLGAGSGKPLGGDSGQSLDRNRALALDLVSSPQIRTALDLGREPRRVRESYGMTLFGQGCLTARRLVEAGSRFVSVFWDEYGLAGSAWDTHWQHYPRMRNELCPGFDRALAGLITDLDQRGMLDDTLVLLLSEHGRTPRLNKAVGGGRDHWSQAYSLLLAGGGVARGKVVGRTDSIAGSVVERPVSPKDILATAYHLLGIDPESLVTDRIGRPLPLVPEAHVLPEVLA